MIDSTTGKSTEVKTKQIDALKRLGHKDLKLDEYEGAQLNLAYLEPVELKNPHSGGSERDHTSR